ncbi:MAG TPA: TetR/AcrR family transcriptional regulator [Ktedonosporobacter sp.]|nr:TetR/AcrR family transcriptional regulator [Ktedonosporobacter sp.]
MSRPVMQDARRAEILEAAIRVLARDGLAETTTRKIATEANVNQAMLRYYFGSKDDLLFAVLQEMMRVTEEIVRSVATVSGSLREVIEASLKAFWEHVESAPELQVMQYELTLYALRNPESAWLAKQQYGGYSAVVEAIIEQACTTTGQPCATPFPTLARFIIGGLDGLILQFISDRDTARARSDLDYLIKSVIALVEGTIPLFPA